MNYKKNTKEIMVAVTCTYKFVHGRRVNCNPFLIWIKKTISA